MDILEKIFKKLNNKERAIIIALLDQVKELKEENDELIEMFVTERCFANIKTKICRKYKNKNAIIDKVECCVLCYAPIAGGALNIKDITLDTTEIV